MEKLGEIKRIEVRQVWPDEARDFTPWLAENLSLLNEELGLELATPNTEEPSWFGWVDVLAQDTERDCACVIENQLKTSDDDHLARLLKYAACHDARTIIWVAPSFRDDHLGTVNWINKNTTDEIEVYCVEIQAIQIDNSRPAALFRSVALPTTRPASQQRGRNSSRAEDPRALEFFQPLLKDLQANGWGESKLYSDVWYRSFDSDFDRITFGAGLSVNNEASVNVWLSLGTAEATNQVFDALHDERVQIESELGIPDDPTVEARWNRRGRNTYAYMDISRKHRSELGEADDEIRSWMKEYLDKLYEIFTPRLERIMVGQGADSDEG